MLYLLIVIAKLNDENYCYTSFVSSVL